MLKILIAILVFCVINAQAFAEEASLSLGRVAENLMEPVGLLSDFVNVACFAIGVAFLFTSLIKYAEHKRSPTMVPISTVVFLVVAGTLLVLLPFLSLFAEGGVRYAIFK
ncbi:MAG: hypothetical protein H0W64_01455 [Gammaproteobacteria bacterium]|nr:hypothetical protein [Gammaproteobacteria bacterium]